jgi:putative ABC transport system permease protein
MIKNYLKIAWRNLVRNKAFSTINILGLALGLCCSLLIMLWVQDERSVDGFHKNGQQLYQVYERNYYDGKVDASYPTQGLLAEELKKVIPEVQYAAGFEYASAPGTQNNFEANDKVSKMGGMFGGADFFTMFSYPLLQGKAELALNAPAGIAISGRMAEYFFGTPQKAIGKTIRFENKEDLQVTAVFENLPANSSQQFDFVRSWTDFVKQNDWVNNWGNASPASFVQLRSNADPVKVEAKIKDFIYRYQKKDKSFVTELAIQPYTEKYLHSNFRNGYIDGGRIEYVRLFSIVAIFILLIACINFMNLATARSAKRAKEVGVRKVIGAKRSALIGQFAGEALLLTFFSVAIAVILAAILLPLFNDITGKQLTLPLAQPVFWMLLIGLLVVTGLVAGSYPALFLSSLNPVRVLKGSLKFTCGATFFRKGLVVFQFTLSVILIVGMMVIYRQMNYIQTKNLGYNRENLIYVPIEGDLVKNYELFKQEATKESGILSVSKMRNSPTVIAHHTGSIEWPGKPAELNVSFADAVVGYDYVKTMKLTLKEGRDFSKEFGTDTMSFILNETAVKKIGFQNPIGQTVTWGNHPGKVIGVLQDFHFNSMHQAIEPLIMRLDDNWSWGTILVRTKAGKTKEALVTLEKICKTVNPKFPFTYQFSDQEYAKLYNSEQVVSKLSNLFAFLAIFISCLGLFGLATFTAEQRTKEIGVRKVLGASVPGIVSLLSTNFLKPVAVAMFIAFPISGYVMNKWLQDFAYKTTIEWWMFGIAALLTTGIALLTVGYQSIRAALSNPVKSLRTE